MLVVRGNGLVNNNLAVVMTTRCCGGDMYESTQATLIGIATWSGGRGTEYHMYMVQLCTVNVTAQNNRLI